MDDVWFFSEVQLSYGIVWILKKMRFGQRDIEDLDPVEKCGFLYSYFTYKKHIQYVICVTERREGKSA
jgi:hypothetical protein